MSSRTRKGQATVEAAVSIPVLFALLLLLLQPGIILYDCMVMRAAAAEGCRLLATASPASGMGQAQCEKLVKRQLSAVPPHDLFHMHSSGCSWRIELAGQETDSQVSVTISNRIKLLPLLDAAGKAIGIADGQGCLDLSVTETAQTQPTWVQESGAGISPSTWVTERQGGL